MAKQDLEEVYAPIRELLKNIIAILLAFVVTIYMLTHFLSRKITSPILKMAEVSKKIQKGLLSARNEVVTSDELGVLAKTFNDMVDSVEQRTIELKKLQASLIHAKKLSAIGKLSASIAHEVNNPICGIRNVLESVANDDFGEEDEAEKKDMVNIAIRECNRIAGLVKSLNDFNRPSSGTPILINVENLINEIIIMYKKKLTEKRIELETVYGNTPLMLDAVSDQLKQVLLNIIQNAEESFPEKRGGKITISTEHNKPEGIIRIHNTGDVINKNDIANLFEPFFTTKSAVKGTGLGLAVCYGIIKKHGGDIKVTSSQKEGTTFAITLPLKGGA